MSSFVVRLLLAALVTFVVVGVVGERLLAHAIRGAFIEEQLTDQQADARSIARAMAEAGTGEEVLDEAQELIDLIASRPSVSDVELIDARGRVLAASERGDVGDIEDGRAAAVARGAGMTVGEETERRSRSR